MGISTTSASILATPKIQYQGIAMKACMYLMKSYNEEIGFLAKPRRAKLRVASFVVILLEKGNAIFFKAGLESGNSKLRRINAEVVEVPNV